VEIGPAIVGELERISRGCLRLDEPMARHTSFGLGGPVDVFVEPPDAESFRECASLLARHEVPTMLLGKGTNILVRRGGLDGAVLTGSEAFSEIVRTDRGVRAGSGVGLPRLLNFCAAEGLAGLEGLAGIPGSAGGAVVMNAGSFGVSIGDRVDGITVSFPGEGRSRVGRNEIEFGYRSATLPAGAMIEEVDLALTVDEPDAIRARQRDTLEKKWKTQPGNMRSAGCVFKNPPGNSAGRMMDEAGLKGKRVGGAVVSDLHANFILNDRGASADDVEELIELVRDRVEERFGVRLELEVEVVGRRGD
jgi:UDP-N-acetylmuramate dehydrogenase